MRKMYVAILTCVIGTINDVTSGPLDTCKSGVELQSCYIWRYHNLFLVPTASFNIKRMNEKAF